MFLEVPEVALIDLHEGGLSLATFRMVPPDTTQFPARLHQNYTLKAVPLQDGSVSVSSHHANKETELTAQGRFQSGRIISHKSAADFEECDEA